MKPNPPSNSNAHPAHTTNDGSRSEPTPEDKVGAALARAASMSRIVAAAGQLHFAHATSSGGLLDPHAKQDQAYAGMRANVGVDRHAPAVRRTA